MRILFLGGKPSPAIEKALAATSFTRVAEPPADLILFFPRTPATLSELSRLRESSPEAWITTVVPKKWLSAPKSLSVLLKEPHKNDLWLRETWELLFWFGVERALSHQRHSEEMARLKSHYAELSASSNRLIRQLEKDVGIATHIQRSLLPQSSPVIPGVSITVKYVPAAGLGGDYYDIFEMVDKKRFGVLVADSKTHGMAAALLSVLLKTRIEEMKERFPDSASFVAYLNREIRSLQGKALAPLALLYGVLDRTSFEFRYTSAGHLKPLWWRGGRLEDTGTQANPALGEVDHFTFLENTLALRPGDRLLFHTDGLWLPFGGASEAPKEKLRNLVCEKAADPLELQNEIMAILDRATERQALSDDVTLIHLAIHDRALYIASSVSEKK